VSGPVDDGSVETEYEGEGASSSEKCTCFEILAGIVCCGRWC